jgi:elongation factor G
MIEACVELDDQAMDAYLEWQGAGRTTRSSADPQGRHHRRLLPGALRLGLQEQGRAAAARRRRRLPARAPLDRPAIKGIDVKTGEETTRKSSDTEPLSLLAFKIMDDQYGVLTFCRIYSGKLEKGMALLNSTRDKNERVGRMVSCTPTTARKSLKPMPATSSRSSASRTPAPATRCAIRQAGHPREDGIPRPRHRNEGRAQDQGRPGKDGVALHKLAAEDPSFRVSTDSGVGRDHHQGHGRTSSRHQGRHPEAHPQGRSANVGAPQVAYREAITRKVTDYTHKKQTGGTGQFARVKLEVEPNEKGKGNEFESKIVGGSVPKEYIPGVEKGLNSVLTSGPLIGFPVVDMKVDADRRRLPRSRLVRDRLRNRHPRRRCAKPCENGWPRAARADHEGRSVAGRVRRRRHRRHQLPPRPDPAPRCAATPTSSTRWCRSPTCSATSTTCAR